MSKDLLTAGILPIWHEKTWDDFVNDSRVKKILQNYVKEFDSAKKDCVGYFIYGNPGTGKSLVANLTFKDLLDKKQVAKVISLGGLVDLVTASWSDSEKKNKLTRLVQNTTFLCIEDFGKEFMRKDDDGRSFATSILEDLLVKRLGFRKPTFLISSVTAGDVTKIYSADLASLVKEACVPLQIIGKDHRDVIQTELKGRWQPKQKTFKDED